ncbi:MAG TPA: tRNA pseudouridine(55) synthase TruB [Terriglobia bacterium]|nr:tRNA pseudouridine(55) synthase TruB [Terriglobia bacterium]
MNSPEYGFLVIDKPEGLTSHDVVVCVRRLMKLRRVGHLGTLDPLATGVLPLAFGRATRLIQFLKEGAKVYLGTIQLGHSTSTYDREGEPTSIGTTPCFSQTQLDEICSEMLGEHWQAPPPFSAKKVRGVRAYQLARQGKTPELDAQKVWIRKLQLQKLSPELIHLEIHCSAGTYVRSVAHDIGKRLGCGAYLASLRRLVSGEFGLERAVSLETLRSQGVTVIMDRMIPISQVLNELPELTVGNETARAFAHGRDLVIESSDLGGERGSLVRIFSERRDLLGLAEVQALISNIPHERVMELHLHPRVVLERIG